MKKYFKLIYDFLIIKNYWLFLLITILISYGQILGMGVWKDDNAIFFKFDHINEQAGFFGTGLLGTGIYKFSITPYYPIYKIFGNENLVPYFVLILTFYFVSTLCVYLLFSRLYSVSMGKIASFLFASGYIASEGFLWLANSMLSHMAILFISVVLIFYNLYCSKKKILFYLLALFFYWLSVFLVPLRAHFFIAIVLAFEVIFFAFKKIPKSLIYSLIRSVPFILVFRQYFISGLDPRTLSIKEYFISILRGDLHNTFSFFTYLSNMIFPDNYINTLFAKDLLLKHVLGMNLPYVIIFSFILLAIYFYILFKKRKKGLVISTISLILTLLWFFISKKIFSFPLFLSQEKLFIVFIGGIVFCNLILFYFLIEKEKKKLYLFLCTWLFVSIGAYASYQPTVFFETTHRYFTSTFISEVGIFALLYLFFNKKRDLCMKLLSILIIFWGLLNIVNSVSYQNLILQTRSIPTSNFYRQLRGYLPRIEKGDILYFNVAGDAIKYFENAFSVSSMPETTAIAWRYGIDRYDFYMAENYDDFIKQISENNIPLEKIHTFFYSKSTGLVSTTDYFMKLNKGYSKNEEIMKESSNFEYDFKNSYSCVIQPSITFTISAKPNIENAVLIDKVNFSLTDAMIYTKAKDYFYDSAKPFVSSEWQERIGSNLIDNNPETIWQAHRITWDKENTYFEFDLGKAEIVGRLVWVNAFSNNTPISYSIETSLDNEKWSKMSQTEGAEKVENGVLNEVMFKPVLTRFIRMVITETIYKDSPGISEAWIIPTGLEGYSVFELENMMKSPQLAVLQGISNASVYWKSNSSDTWQNNYATSFKLITDGKIRTYTVNIPCDGTELTSIKLDNFQFPLNIGIRNLKINYSPIR